MRNYLVADRYARGLSGSVEDPARLEAILQALNELEQLYESDHDFRSVLANPTIDLDVRTEVLNAVLEKMSAPDEIVRFARVLLNRGRINILPEVASEFARMVDVRLNRIEAVVTSATPLTSEQETTVTQGLTAFSGKAVRVTSAVDEEILGGVVARIGSTVIDGSLRARLDQLKTALLSEET